MTLARGDRFGSYEIVDLVGVGGMGEVYRAKDARLQRDVALKVLPESRLLDPEALQRFEREARLLASLNHPNIATLHGLETSGDRHALVMELIDGETLDDRLRRLGRGHGLPLAGALEIARQIADALDAAHERGVVHRDLKPANIKIRPDGTVKVLDFGIAKAFDPHGSDGRGATAGITELAGAIVGTASYMSPEQATGRTVDRRTDIWSFGCVLYEMLTGQRAFEAETDSGTLARVIEREPDWTRLPASLPPAVRMLLQRCLEKDLRKRRRDSGDVVIDLQQALGETAADRGQSPGTGHSSRARRVLTVVAAAVAAAAIGVLALRAYTRPHVAAPEVVRLSVLPPGDSQFATPLLSGSGVPVGGTVSPDGRKLAFTARDAAGAVHLWVRPLDSIDAVALPGTEDAALPFWSPDGKSLGFFAEGALKRVDLAGGPPQVLCPSTRGQGGTWNRDGVIVFAPSLRSTLLRVSASGGEPVPVTTLGGHVAHRFPQFLPNGERFLFHVEGPTREESGVFVASLGAGDGRRLLAADTAAVFAEPDLLLFVRQGTLLAQRFDAVQLVLIGDPFRVAQPVPSEGAAPAFSASGTSVLTYRTGPADSDRQQLAWFDRTGKLLEAIGMPGTYRGIDLSPDGTRVAVHNHEGGGGDIWVFEPRGTTTRVTFDPSQDNSSPIWSPDGSRIAFGSLREGKWGLYEKPASGEGNARLLIESEVPKIPASWSPDGTRLVYWLYEPGNDPHQWVLPIDGDSPPTQLMDSPFYDGHGQISPDGRWIAYMSVPARRPEIFLRTFPAGERVWQVSTNGGVTSRWRRDGKELFYMTSYDHGALMAVDIDASGVPGVPRELFTMDIAVVPHSTAVPNFHTYAVSPDGERFLIPITASKLRGEGLSTAITVVLNWTQLLER